MALIKNYRDDKDGVDLEETVAETAKALAMMIIPIIRDISDIEIDDVSTEDDGEFGD